MIKQRVSTYLSGFVLVFFTGFSPFACAQDLLEIYELALQNDPSLKQAHASQLATCLKPKSKATAPYSSNCSGVT